MTELRRTDELLAGMKSWRRFGEAPSMEERTPEQEAWDLAISAAAELVRRIDNRDERRCRILRQLSTPTADASGRISCPEFVP